MSKQKGFYFRVDEKLFNEFKQFCEQQNISMGGKIVEMISEFVTETRTKRKVSIDYATMLGFDFATTLGDEYKWNLRTTLMQVGAQHAIGDEAMRENMLQMFDKYPVPLPEQLSLSPEEMLQQYACEYYVFAHAFMSGITRKLFN